MLHVAVVFDNLLDHLVVHGAGAVLCPLAQQDRVLLTWEQGKKSEKGIAPSPFIKTRPAVPRLSMVCTDWPWLSGASLGYRLS